jgi:DNA-binding NtrC family response regulator
VGEAFAAPSASRVTAEGATLGLHAYVEGGLPLVRAREELVRDFERAYVAHMLERHGGNVRRAAAAAGVAHRYFQLLKSRLT